MVTLCSSKREALMLPPIQHLRSAKKEEANDYRYFPEPDLPPLHITNDYINNIKASMPALPQQLMKRYQAEVGLSEYDAEQICLEKEIAGYFEEVLLYTKNYKAAASSDNRSAETAFE